MEEKERKKNAQQTTKTFLPEQIGNIANSKKGSKKRSV